MEGDLSGPVCMATPKTMESYQSELAKVNSLVTINDLYIDGVELEVVPNSCGGYKRANILCLVGYEQAGEKKRCEKIIVEVHEKSDTDEPAVARILRQVRTGTLDSRIIPATDALRDPIIRQYEQSLIDEAKKIF